MTIKDELQKLYDRYVEAYQRKDADGCAAIFTPDAQLYSPYAEPAIGREAIGRVHEEWTLDEGENKRITVVEAKAAIDTAWCLAEFSESEKTVDGISVNILERQSDGGWLIRICSLNDRVPPSA